MYNKYVLLPDAFKETFEIGEEDASRYTWNINVISKYGYRQTGCEYGVVSVSKLLTLVIASKYRRFWILAMAWLFFCDRWIRIKAWLNYWAIAEFNSSHDLINYFYRSLN